MSAPEEVVKNKRIVCKQCRIAVKTQVDYDKHLLSEMHTGVKKVQLEEVKIKEQKTVSVLEKLEVAQDSALPEDFFDKGKKDETEVKSEIEEESEDEVRNLEENVDKTIKLLKKLEKGYLQSKTSLPPKLLKRKRLSSEEALGDVLEFEL